MKSLCFAVVLLGFAAPTLAHQDMVIEVGSDGALRGLPKQYEPARLSITFTKDKRPHVASVELRIAEKSVALPDCMIGILETQASSDIHVSASWYHDPRILPPYLHVEFFDPGYNAKSWANGSYSMLFNLDTGRLIKMEVNIVRDGGKALQGLPIDAARQCHRADLSNVLDEK